MNYIELIIAVDFDGTLCQDMYPHIGMANEHLISELIELKKLGAKLILWTCRSGNLLEEAVSFCVKNGLSFDAVNENLPEIIERYGSDSRKISADIYIDDRGVKPWERILKVKSA